MKKENATARYKNYKIRDRWIDFLIAIILALIAFSPLCEECALWKYAKKYIIFGTALALIYLFYQKGKQIQKGWMYKQQYKKELKINQINKTIFEAISQANAAKTRETLRYTYGTVTEWNPINYRKNILLYDVHEQLRSILISLKKIVISIDPTRFHDKNVSVELVYCYPALEYNQGKLPTKMPDASQEELDDGKEGTKPRSEKRWRLISSGDTSGNHSKVIDHLTEPTSFYTFLDCFGTKFVNRKCDSIISQDQVDKIRLHLHRSGYYNDCFIGTKFYTTDIKDCEFSQTNNPNGSIAGTVINVRNDNPEEVFVKAILTINTYGETLHEPIFEKRKKNSPKNVVRYDKDGLTEEDFSNLFCRRILDTYKTLLASELSQMYIRHKIQTGKKCPITGRDSCKEKREAGEFMPTCHRGDCSTCCNNQKLN